MSIKSGIGIGEAQIVDNSGILNTYAKLIQKQQQDEAKFQNGIADIISNIDTKGIRDADKGDIVKMYDAAKGLYAQATSARSPQERALLRSRLSKSVSDLNEYAQNSIGISKKLDSLANNMSTAPWAYHPDSVDKIKGLINTPLSKMGPDISFSPLDYQRLPSEKTRDSVFGAVRKQGEEFATSKISYDSPGKWREVKHVPDSKLSQMIKLNLSTDPEYKALAISDWSSANPGKPIDVDQLVANELNLYKVQHPNDYKGNLRDIPTREPKEPSNEDSWDKIVSGAFSNSRAKYIANINAISGDNAKVSLDKNNNIVVESHPVINIGTKSNPMYERSEEPRFFYPRNSADLRAVLQQSGITGAGSKSIIKLGGASGDVSKPIAKPSVKPSVKPIAKPIAKPIVKTSSSRGNVSKPVPVKGIIDSNL